MAPLTKNEWNAGSLVISLDFELYWGVRDIVDEDAFLARAEGVRTVIPGMLALFEKHRIHATWATVGMLTCDSKEALNDALPDIRPSYVDAQLTNYRDLDRVVDTGPERALYFGADLVDQISNTPHQEIGTHTFSHYYTNASAQSAAEFAADLDAADAVWRQKGIAIKSIVFPRNQVNLAYLPLCAARGIAVYRGNPVSLFHDSDHAKFKSPPFRAVRLLDGMFNITGRHLGEPAEVVAEGGARLIDVPASRYLRACGAKLGLMDRARLRRIRADMTAAARAGKIYHLWWHPHNFGAHPHANLELLEAILTDFADLRVKYNFQSQTMSEAAGL